MLRAKPAYAAQGDAADHQVILAELTRERILYASLDGVKSCWSLRGKGNSCLESRVMSLLPCGRRSQVCAGSFWDHILPVNDTLMTWELFAQVTLGVELAGMLHERTFHCGPERVEFILVGKRLSMPVAADG